METPTHTNLKRAALEFLLGQGCAAAAIEVGCPISRYRIDVAGYLDKLPERRKREVQAGPFPRGAAATTVFIECKASRADFLRDQRQAPMLLQRRAHLQRSLDRLRHELVKPMEPHLRRSEGFLFPELEAWDFNLSRLHSHRALVRALRQVDRKLYNETKFFMISQYRLAARLYILAPRGLIHARELPGGWGLLEADLRTADLAVRQEAPLMTTGERHVLRTLRNIAAAASRDHRNAVIRRAIVPGAGSVAFSGGVSFNGGVPFGGGVPGRDAISVRAPEEASRVGEAPKC